MNEYPNVVIVLARCSHSKGLFGVRLEERQSKQWLADWAFKIKETAARKEGYDHNEIQGSFGFDQAYPGCPGCGAHGLYLCQCGRVACWDNDTKSVCCPWCCEKGEIIGTVEKLNVRGDR